MNHSFITHNDMGIAGTSHVGSVETTYARLVEVFGEHFDPCDLLPDGKTDVLRTVLFSRRRLATIDNYKDGPNYMGGEGTPVERITEWRVGGKRREVIRFVAETLGLTEESRDGLGFLRFRATPS